MENELAAALRVMTWNLWWQCGPWEQRQPAIEETLKQANADVIFLQEVWAEPEGRNQAARLAQALGYEYEYATATIIDGIELGNAVLSRWPLVRSGALELPAPDGVPEGRCAVYAEIEAPFGRFFATTTHLTWQRNNSHGRQQQVAAILNMIDTNAQHEWPPIFGGDFNADADSDEIGMITGRNSLAHKHLVFQDAWLQAGDGSPGFTWTPDSKHYPASRSREVIAMPWLRRRLDYIFVGLPDGRAQPTLAVQVENCWLAGIGSTDLDEGSDHYAVITDLKPHRIS